MHPPAEPLAQVLSGCSRLTHLRIDSVLFAEEDQTPSFPISLPLLKVFEYHRSSIREIDFSNCRLPSLERLQIGEFYTARDLRPVFGAITHLNASGLRHLTLTQLPLDILSSLIVPKSLWAICPNLKEF